MTAAERTDLDPGSADIDYEALALEWEEREFSDAEVDALLSSPIPVPPEGGLMPSEEAAELLAEMHSVSVGEAAETLKRLRGE